MLALVAIFVPGSAMESPDHEPFCVQPTFVATLVDRPIRSHEHTNEVHTVLKMDITIRIPLASLMNPMLSELGSGWNEGTRPSGNAQAVKWQVCSGSRDVEVDFKVVLPAGGWKHFFCKNMNAR